jgi:error-prone DNA polymerase
LGFAAYFLTVAEVVRLTRSHGIRVSARGSGAGSFINHLLGISALNPLDYGLLMERFLSPLRSSLPDIDIDVESHRRLEVYDAVFERFGKDRVACVSMMDTYRVRHAIRDVGRAVGMPNAEIDTFAKAFPRIRARDIRKALAELPELQTSGFAALTRDGRLNDFVELVEGLDKLPRSIALHPCGVILSDSTLLNRTPVQASGADYAMSHYDKDDVETLGFLKLDILGIRMQSAIAHTLSEVERTTGDSVDIDRIPFDDTETFQLIQSTRTLGCFQIESPGQRELVGKFGPESFDDLIIDISLFRPGPVKSDMITPFLQARHGWSMPRYMHPRLQPILMSTSGVVVFHEQVIQIVAELSGCTLAEADEVRRGLGTWESHDQVRGWLYPLALQRGFELEVIDEVWEVLRAFASFGFCKAHAGAFAVPTYQSAWLKTHYPAAFYAGILTHDPGMYPARFIIHDAQAHGVTVLPIDINRSADSYVVEAGYETPSIRMPLTQIHGISLDEVNQAVAHAPYHDIVDVWERSGLSRPSLERLITIGGCDSLLGIGMRSGPFRLTRRDVLVFLAELDRWQAPGEAADMLLAAPHAMVPTPTGLPDFTESEKVEAELAITGVDLSHHVMDFHRDLLVALGVTYSRDLLRTKTGQQILIAGAKVATQTPPIRSGKRVIFVTLDDSTGPVDAALFEDVQGKYANTVFHSWTLLVRGVVRRTGARGVSIRATGAWSIAEIEQRYRTEFAQSHNRQDAIRAIHEFLAQHEHGEAVPAFVGSRGTSRQRGGMSRGGREVLVHPSGFRLSPWADTAPPGSLSPPSKLWHTSPGTPG